MAGKVTGGLAESNGSLPPSYNLLTMHVCVAVGLVGGGGSPPPAPYAGHKYGCLPLPLPFNCVKFLIVKQPIQNSKFHHNYDIPN